MSTFDGFVSEIDREAREAYIAFREKYRLINESILAEAKRKNDYGELVADVRTLHNWLHERFLNTSSEIEEDIIEEILDRMESDCGVPWQLGAITDALNGQE